MSEEGELKKRIHKAYGELDDEICREECLPNIDKILDEAKKEVYELLKGDPLNWLYHTGEIKQTYEKLLLKWFGHE